MGDHLSGLNKAEKFIGDFTGRPNNSKILDDNNDCSFGEFGFQYLDKTEMLVARVYISKLGVPDPSDEEKEGLERFLKALFNPEIGGLFDHGGGTFFADYEKKMLFLTKKFPINEVSYKQFKKEMNVLINTAAKWSMRWISKVAAYAHGWEPLPDKSINTDQ